MIRFPFNCHPVWQWVWKLQMKTYSIFPPNVTQRVCNWSHHSAAKITKTIYVMTGFNKHCLAPHSCCLPHIQNCMAANIHFTPFSQHYSRLLIILLIKLQNSSPSHFLKDFTTVSIKKLITRLYSRQENVREVTE